jgi:hypothetical protein
MAVGNFDLKIPTENIPSVNPLVFSEFLVVRHFHQSSHNLQLWLEAGITDGPNKNHIYSLTMTLTWDIRVSCIISLVGT